LEDYIDQISKYFINVPLWPFFLLGFVGLVSLVIEMVNRKRREAAVENFRAMFEEDLPGLYPTVTRWPENISGYLCSRLPEMQHHFEVLRVFIPQKQLRDYNMAWNKYCDFCRSMGSERHATDAQSSTDSSAATPAARNDDALKQEFHQLITDLLAFAKPR
jgi:hypothetical protein